MKQFTHRLEIQSRGKGLYEFTRDVSAWVKSCVVQAGLLTIFLQHTSASLVIQENADPDVRADLNEFFERLASEEAAWYRHTVEGPDDMPAHIRAALTQTNLSVPVVSGKLALGTWQGIFLFEHRAHPHQRTVMLHLIGA